MDLFSKYAWVRVTKAKDKKTIADAFEDILKKSGRQPLKLWSDGTGEYDNQWFRGLLRNIIQSRIVRKVT